MSDARRIALRGAIVALLVAPLVELANRAFSAGPGPLYELRLAAELALATALANACVPLEGRGPLRAFAIGAVASVLAWGVVDLHFAYVERGIEQRSLESALSGVRGYLANAWRYPWGFVVEALRGGLAVGWVACLRARWPESRSQQLVLAFGASALVTVIVNVVASAHDPGLLAAFDGAETYRLELGIDAALVLALVLAPSWADALDRRLAARAE